MFKAGEYRLQTYRPQPLTNSMLFTTKDVNRLAEMCAMFAWRRRCRIARIDVAHDARWGYTQARVSIR